MSHKNFTASFADPQQLSNFVSTALAHQGRLLPEKTHKVAGHSFSPMELVEVTVEVPETNVESFKMCAFITDV